MPDGSHYSTASCWSPRRLAQAAGRIAAETITPYPPGIPILAPGERITAPVVAYLQAGLAAGMYVAGIDQPCEPRVRVVQ